jgi:hypothetical protein
MHGDAKVFVREDAVKRPGLLSTLSSRMPQVCIRTTGSWGPHEADRLVIDVGGWHDPEERKESTALLRAA